MSQAASLCCESGIVGCPPPLDEAAGMLACPGLSGFWGKVSGFCRLFNYGVSRDYHMDNYDRGTYIGISGLRFI